MKVQEFLQGLFKRIASGTPLLFPRDDFPRFGGNEFWVQRIGKTQGISAFESINNSRFPEHDRRRILRFSTDISQVVHLRRKAAFRIQYQKLRGVPGNGTAGFQHLAEEVTFKTASTQDFIDDLTPEFVC